jgi:four helix bundle protein
VQDFRKLRVWRKAHILALRVRPATRTFPKTGYSTLKSQMTTAAESIAFNIVEGCGTDSQKEFARFLEISIKSTSELEYQLQLATDYGVLPLPQWTKLTKP